MVRRLSEKQLERIWQYQLPANKVLMTEDGEPVTVIFPGRGTDKPGADFRDAVLAIGRVLIKGDVELHLKSSGWWEHGHHHNAAYNRVILHVVMWHNSDKVARLENGRVVPVLALGKYFPAIQWSGQSSPLPISQTSCLDGQKLLSAETVAGFLDQAGEERFFIKAARFEADFARIGAGQSLYQGLMGALGYATNKLPFLELGRILPLSVLEETGQDKPSDADYLLHQQALLLGTAGLLPSFSRPGQIRTILAGTLVNELWRRWHASGRVRVMPVAAWHLLGIRPNNSPVRRLVAMSHLLLRFREKGMFEEMTGRVMEAMGSRDGCRRLEEALLVATGDEGTASLAFGLGTGKVTLLGRGRTADIIVNILLP
ncbi:MAG: DUF2851 family protein, partial [Chloroflexi bacterium]|nr:DUF2851 family protein [Chloroflexota bacterium]